MKPMMATVAFAAFAMLGACAPKPAATTTAAAAPVVVPACDTFKEGQNGVMKLYCKGKASANVKVGDKSYALTGGTCELYGGEESVFIGVLATEQLTGVAPDAFVMTVFTGTQGPFTGATFKMVLDGKTISVSPNKGTFEGKGGKLTGGTFEGTSRFNHQAVSGTFSCG